MATYYIDPTYEGTSTGSISQPYKSWFDFTVQNNNTYLQKRGTFFRSSSYIYKTNPSGITFGSYGSGERPYILFTGDDMSFFYFDGGKWITIENLKIENVYNADGTITLSAHGGRSAHYNTVRNCEVIGGWRGINSEVYPGESTSFISNLTIEDCIIHETERDGILAKSSTSSTYDGITIRRCHIYNVNRRWLTYFDGSCDGDCIHLLRVDNFLVEDCILDRRGTSYKFCFIHGGSISNESGTLRGNILYVADWHPTWSSNAIYIQQGFNELHFEKNIVINRGDPSGKVSGLGPFRGVTVHINHNVFDHVGGMSYSPDHTDYLYFNNNIVLHRPNTEDDEFFTTQYAVTYTNNNLFLFTTGSTLFSDGSNGGGNFHQSNNIRINSYDLNEYDDFCKFVDINNQNYRILKNSNLINSGNTYSGILTSDIEGSVVPFGGLPDIGPYEYNSIGMEPPTGTTPVVYYSGFTANWINPTGAESIYIDVSKYSGFTSYEDHYINYNVGNVTSFNVCYNISPNIDYYYRLRAVSAVSGTSEYSNTISLTTPYKEFLTPSPTATTVTNMSELGFTLNWDSVSNLEFFQLSLSSDSDFSSFVSGHRTKYIPGDQLELEVDASGLDIDQVYYYRIRGYDSFSGISYWSNTSNFVFTLDTLETYYIDLGWSGSTFGSYIKPFNSWNQVTFYNNKTYLQKLAVSSSDLGASDNPLLINSNIFDINNLSGITFGTYSGETGGSHEPYFYFEGNNNIKLTDSGNISFQDYHITSVQNVDAFYFSGNCYDILMDGCSLENASYGIYCENMSGLTLNSVKIYNMSESSIYGNISYLYIDSSKIDGNNGSIICSGGTQVVITDSMFDGIENNNDLINIEYDSNLYTSIITDSYFMGPSGLTNNTIYLNNAGDLDFKYNQVLGPNRGVYYSGTTFNSHYCIYESDTTGIIVDAGGQVYNNVFNGNSTGLTHISTNSLLIRNNIFYQCDLSYDINSTYASEDYNCFYPTATTYGVNSIVEDPLFFAPQKINKFSIQSSTNTSGTNVSTGFFVNFNRSGYHVSTGSTCISNGVNLGITTDYDGESVSNPPNIGIYELVSQVYYIDPDDTGSLENGTKTEPYTDWSQATLRSDCSYLQKSGTETTLSSYINVSFDRNVYIGSYGSGNRPIINGSNGDVAVVYIESSRFTTIEGLYLWSNINDPVTGGVNISGHWSYGVTLSTLIKNCEIYGSYNGVRSLPYNGYTHELTISDTDIHYIREDGLYVSQCHDVMVNNSYVYDVNLDYVLQGTSEAEAPGDCLQIHGDSDNFKIINNILDRRGPYGNKFCFIHGGSTYSNTNTGEIIGNVFYPSDIPTALYMQHGYQLTISGNTWIGTDGMNNNIGYIGFTNVDFNYNLIENCENLYLTSDTQNVNVLNNTFSLHGNTDATRVVYVNGTDLVNVFNNIFVTSNSTTNIYNDGGLVSGYTNYETNDIADIHFSDTDTSDYSLMPSSPCVNAGTNVGLNSDIIGNPIVGYPDIGAYEYESSIYIDPPTATTATYVNYSGFTSNWIQPLNVDGYYLDVSTNINFSTYVVGYNNRYVGNVSSYMTNSNIQSETNYYYRLRSYNSDSGVTSAHSNTISLRTTTAPYVDPVVSPPTGTTATNVNYSGFTANWLPSSLADTYHLDISTNSEFSTYVVGYRDLNVGNVTEYIVNSNLLEGTNYYYRLRAYNSDSGLTSLNSNIILATTTIHPSDTFGPIIYYNSSATPVTGTTWWSNRQWTIWRDISNSGNTYNGIVVNRGGIDAKWEDGNGWGFSSNGLYNGNGILCKMRPSEFKGNSPYTISLYTKVSSNDDFNRVLGIRSFNNRSGIGIGGTNSNVGGRINIHDEYGNSFVLSQTGITLGSWYYVAITHSNQNVINRTSTYKLYVNGVFQNSGLSYIMYPEYFFIGMDVGPKNRGYNGNVKFFKLWDRELTSQQIYSDYLVAISDSIYLPSM